MKIRKLFVLIASLMIALVLIGCDNNKNNENEYIAPAVSNPDTQIEGLADGYKLSQLELYKSIKANGGLTLLLQMLDEKLLNGYTPKYTSTTLEQAYQNRYNKMVYNTTDEDEIAALSDDEKTALITDYQNTMKLMGYNTDESQKAYIDSLALRDVFAEDYIYDVTKNNANKYSNFIVKDEDVEEWYNSSLYNTATGVIVSFDSVYEFKSVVESLGCAVVNSEIREVTDPTISKRNLTVENTGDVNPKDIAIALYNAEYGYRTPITDSLEYSFKELSKGSSEIAYKLFSMEDDEFAYFAVKTQVSYGSVYTIIYKESDTTNTEYKNLTDEQKDVELKNYIHNYCLTASNVSQVLNEYRSENGIVFYDKDFASDYVKSNDQSYDYASVKSDGNKVVECANVVVTADDFYNYTLGIAKDYYVMNALILQVQENLNSFSLFYGDEKDLNKNASLRMISFYKSVLDYVEQNYTGTTDAEYQAFLYAQSGYNTLEDVVNNYYCLNDLKTVTVLDLLYSTNDEGKLVLNEKYVEKFQDVLDDYNNSFYSLYGYELVISIDADGDYLVDDLTDTASTTGAYSDLLTYITSTLLIDCDTVSEAIEELSEFSKLYNSSTSAYVSDTENENNDKLLKIAEFKKKGLMVKYQAVNNGSLITELNYGSNNTEALNNAFKALYDKFISESKTSSTSYLLNDDLVYDKDGAHFIFAKFGNKITDYTFTQDSIEEDDTTEYNQLSFNEDSELSLAQLYGSFYNYLYQSMFESADKAEKDFNITTYPSPFPSKVKGDTDALNELLAEYFLNDSFVNVYYATELGYSEAAAIYEYFLNE